MVRLGTVLIIIELSAGAEIPIIILLHDRIWMFFEFRDECMVSCGAYLEQVCPFV